jgi:glycosyltransferase involved in cell wall biosynthesis
MSLPRRIVHYYPRALTGDGGLTLAVNTWAEAEASGGFEVVVLHHGGENDGRLSNRVKLLDVPHRGGILSRRTLRPEGLHRFLDPSDLLVLHSGWWFRNFVAANAARRSRTPYMVMPHGAYDPHVTAKRRTIRAMWEPRERRLLNQACAVHVFFDSEVEEVNAFAPGARTIVAPTGFDLPSRTWRGGGGYLAWIGRYDFDHKGVDVLLRAAAEIPASQRPRLIVRGRPYRQSAEDARALARSLGVDEHVEVGLEVGGEEKIQLLLKCDGFVYPSRWESYGLSAVESMALGVPTAISSTMHIASSIAEKDAAILASPQPPDIATALLRLVREGTGYGARGRQFVATELSWPRLLERWTDQLSVLPPFARR